MNPLSAVRPSWLAPLLFVLAAAVFSLTGPASADAQVKISGKATFTLGVGKAGKIMKKQRVRIKRVAPAKLKRLTRKRSRVFAPARFVKTGPAKVGLNGGFVFRRGKRALPVRGLVVISKKGTILVRGKLGGKKITVFKGSVNGPARRHVATGRGTTTIKINGGSLRFTPKAAKLVKRKLKLRKKVPAAAYGKLAVNAKRTETKPGLKDPYLAQCGIVATSKATTNLPPAASLPDMTGAKTLVGSPDFAWGFKDSFRGYVEMFGGSLHALDGAGRDGSGAFDGFTFPTTGGAYKANDPVDIADDQAVIEGAGASVYCNPQHVFRITISNPTVVIDGVNSRLIADVDLNLSGEWVPSQRVDLAKLDLSGVSPFYNRSGSEVTWSNIPATLTAAGRDAFCRPAEGDLPEQCLYDEGDALDPITVTAKTPYKLGNGEAGMDSLANYVKDELPFPLDDRTIGGCELANLSGGSASQARTIDEYLYQNGNAPTPIDPPASAWTDSGASPASLPDLTGGETLTGGELDWGVLRGLRSSASGTGEFNLYGGATASSTWFGVGGTETETTGYGTKIGAPNAFFKWPAATTVGTYNETDGVKRLVLHTKGRAAICNTSTAPAISYGTVVTNPTVVIDGADSRITADIATRYRLSWVRGTVDVASFDAADATVTESTAGGTTTVKWALPQLASTPAYGGSKTSMTAAGSAVLRMLGNTYLEGAEMDNPTITASFPAE